jgi:hypothetical protein
MGAAEHRDRVQNGCLHGALARSRLSQLVAAGAEADTAGEAEEYGE